MFRPLDHLRRNVDADDAREAFGQGLREPSDAASEVERAIGFHRDAQPRQLVQQRRDLADAGLKKAVKVPFAAVLGRVRQDRPQRIALRVGVPQAAAGLERLAHRGHEESR